MNVVIINCFDTYHDRVTSVYNFFASRNYNIKVIQSNFKHIQKVKIEEKNSDYVYVDVRPYYKNLSVDRLYSHYKFSKRAFNIVNSLNPDIVYVLLPPNSLAKDAKKYKNNNPQVKLILDIIDLWPETMPVGKINSIFPFNIWKNLRDENLKDADYIITECELFKEKIKTKVLENKISTIHLAKKEKATLNIIPFNTEYLNICYLGSINNIIDIPLIGSLLKELGKYKKINCHVIGTGENQKILFKEIEKSGAKLIYHGKVYDREEKQKVFDQCQFGLNIMKPSVCVGLTMKSLDYFCSSLPVINNIPSDTKELVDKYNIGYNLNENNLEIIAKEIAELSYQEWKVMKKNTFEIYSTYFTIDSFNEKMSKVLESLLASEELSD